MYKCNHRRKGNYSCKRPLKRHNRHGAVWNDDLTMAKHPHKKYPLLLNTIDTGLRLSAI